VSAARVVNAAPIFHARRAAVALDGLARCMCDLAQMQDRLDALRATVEASERVGPDLQVIPGGKGGAA
jgi:hypothetical protein